MELLQQSRILRLSTTTLSKKEMLEKGKYSGLKLTDRIVELLLRVNNIS